MQKLCRSLFVSRYVSSFIVFNGAHRSSSSSKMSRSA